MRYYIKADRFLLENTEKYETFLTVQNGRFGEFVNTVPDNEEIIDWSGYTIAPGLLDTHIHGINGHDIMDGTVEAAQRVSAALPALGVTRFLPTTLTSSEADLNRSIRAVVAAVNSGLSGAKSEGIFLEGPYFTEKHKGAQNQSYFRDPDYDEFNQWQDLAENTIVKIALAPERDGAIDFIRKVSSGGVFVSIAHTDASYDCCKNALDAGASSFVHLFNGMSGLHHREPGVVGAALMNKGAFAEMICDGHHVHPDIAAMVVGMKGDKTVLITDCMRAGLLPDGNYHLGEFSVVLKDGVARTETGSLAGSTLQLIDGVKKLHEWCGRSLHVIWHLASLSPAKSIGRDSELGSIQTGKLADYVVIDDGLNIQATAIEGKITYQVKR
ncbi:N-acetylglucosamine-6-phosphate deacetylase [Halobacillus shinanisalinarum]|uniref:N-acetylglucosamine-6-phosphate deacetylase n=1 Tax=Halobacillus shinanisalinarum TaxID=2932258 RepID=A0ABY4GX15_9BACI|nr:N-acetylglucosamine-6-phosphate deacetylase [Halobacillus shinanisalinarum]UOQ91952.1 N-acetylglucosamine-6-phosphate deacetylase [Halobacillus shinanisalinarum]